MTHRQYFIKGAKDGIPIFLGYFAVALTLGITAKNAGITPFQAMLTSLTNNTSAGEFIGFTLIAEGGSYLEMIVMEFVANARYLLMSCALSQKMDTKTPVWQRLLMGHGVTDEIFGLSISVPRKLDPFYTYGAIAVAVPGWTGGTFFGVILGNVLPVSVVSALSVGLFGMFIAAFIPPAKKDRVVAGTVAAAFALSFLVNRWSVFSGMSSGMKTILLTVVISAAAALLFPRKEEEADVG